MNFVAICGFKTTQRWFIFLLFCRSEVTGPCRLHGKVHSSLFPASGSHMHFFCSGLSSATWHLSDLSFTVTSSSHHSWERFSFLRTCAIHWFHLDYLVFSSSEVHQISKLHCIINSLWHVHRFWWSGSWQNINKYAPAKEVHVWITRTCEQGKRELKSAETKDLANSPDWLENSFEYENHKK